MILTCPGCSARYRVKDGLIPPVGKKVKCKKCGVVFRAFPDGRCEALRAAAPPTPAPPPSQPAATATVRVDAEKIQALVMQQQSAGQDGRKPLPEMPENVVVEQRPLQTAGAVPETIPPPQSETPAEPRKSFTEFREGLPPSADGDVPEPESQAAQVDAFKEAEMKTGETSSSEEEIQKSDAPALGQEQENGFDVGESPQADFRFDAPPDDDAEESALKSELDEFRFELPEEPTPEEPVSEELSQEPFAEQETQDPFADLAVPGVDSVETAAMPAADEPDLGPTPVDLSSDVGFPDIETDELESPETSGESEGLDVPPEESDGLDVPPAEDPAVMPTPEPSTVEPGPMEEFFQAKIDGTLYPKLTMDVIDRWIREGRLLESDQLAVEGSGGFKRADQFSQFGDLFSRYFGKTSTSSAEKNGKEKKKGFFARLFKK